MRGWIHSLILLSLFSPVALAAKPIAVLVPGFFNSLADGSAKGPYFSANVVETVQAAGFEVYVVNNLLPLGGIDENAKRLTAFLKGIASRPGAEQGLTLVGHSAGGLYSMRALTLDPTLPVKTLATISTPFTGIAFITRLTDSSVVQELIRWFRLDSLLELTAPAMQNFLQSVNLPDHVRVIIAGGEQKPCLLVTCAQAQRLSWVLTITGNLNGQISDGIVPLNSSLGYSAASLRMSDKIRLEHWEQVLDYRAFSLLGTANTGFIRDEQRRFYTALMETVVR
jgi:pimeloyl-ACP methyl ester carboxylesterase